MLADLINANYSSLNESDLHVLNFIIKNVDLCLKSTLSEISKLCNVSSSTISRTTQKLGFEGYTQFRFFLEKEKERIFRESKNKAEGFNSSVLLDDFSLTVRFFEQNNSLYDIYELLLSADRIFAYGTGHSQRLMINEFSRCLLHLNLFLNLIPSKTEFDTILENITDKDIIFVVGLSGNIDSIKQILHTLSLEQVPIISVTLFSSNDLATVADYNLYYQLSSYNLDKNRNNSTFLTLNLVLALLFEGLTNYIHDKVD